MVKPKRKKLLVAVDGTDSSLDTVRYIAHIKPFMNMDVVLYHIFSQVPEHYWDISKEPKSRKTMPQMWEWEKQMRTNRAWEKQTHEKLEEFMGKCRNILLSAEYAPQQIKIKLQNRKKGIVRDIVAEARKEYAVIVLRRRGLAGLKGMILGDVSSRLLENLTFLPMIIAGKKPVNNRILIAVDGSRHAQNAVTFVGKILGGKGYKIGLVHVLRSTLTDMMMEQTFEDARSLLMAHGFSSEGISTKVITEESSRAGGIVNEAEKEDYCTIVTGRRGLSNIQQYFIGRVSNKVIHVGRRFTVWLIN